MFDLIYTNYGSPVQADEGRTGAVCKNRQGDCCLVIAARGYVLLVNPDDGACQQMYFPDNNQGYPYSCYSSKDGLFYIGAGDMLMTLDPFQARFVAHYSLGVAGEAAGFSITEGPDGSIFAASYPNCRLLRCHPQDQTWEDLGRLHTEEEYPFSLAADASGWLYAGVGTERCTIVAWNLATGTAETIIEGPEGMNGRGEVRSDADGNVYGRLSTGDHPNAQPWYRLREGAVEPIDSQALSESEYTGEGFDAIHRQFAAPWRLLSCSLANREVVLLHTQSGQEKTIPLHYKARNADLSPLALGPDGLIYGTSNHPLHLFTFDPESNQMTNLGGTWIENGGGGNICAYAVQQQWLVGAAYAGGHIHILDTARPLRQKPSDQRNPKLVVSVPDIFRPRSSLAHPDGQHVIFGGFGDYGLVGGGLYIRNLIDHSELVLSSGDLLPHHSTMCIAALHNGDLLCGTSIEAPGGGKPKEQEACIYRLDWQSKQVMDRVVPIADAKEINMMAIDRQGFVHAFTEHCYFVYDLGRKEVKRRLELDGWGSAVRQGLAIGKNGLIYGIRSKAIFVIDDRNATLKRLSVPPVAITGGLALDPHEGRLFFTSESQLWSMTLADDIRRQGDELQVAMVARQRDTSTCGRGRRG